MPPLPDPSELGLVQMEDKPDEWWVTVAGRYVIGFAGEDARVRAERYFQSLARICRPRVPQPVER